MTSEHNSEARQTFFGCVYRNAQSSPAEIGRLYANQVHDQKQLTTEVVKLMESAFTVAMAESKDLRFRLDALEAEKYALEDQVRGLQELMAAGEQRNASHESMLRHFASCADVRQVGTQAMDFVAGLPKPTESGASE
jgi:hypothetical protein